MSDPTGNDGLVSIWTWSGALLLIYGVIIGGMGLHYLAEPETRTATAQLNPSLWWGACMLVAGVCLLLLPRLGGNGKGPGGGGGTPGAGDEEEGR